MATATAQLSTWTDGANPAITLTQPGMADASGTVWPNGVADLSSRWIRAQASVVLTGTPGERVDYYRFGFIQLKFITDDWAHYRGPTNTDGSVFLAMDKPPARPQQLCRDAYTVGQGTDVPLVGPVLFYDGDKWINPTFEFMVRDKAAVLLPNTVLPATGTYRLILTFADSPERFVDLVTQNNQFAPSRQNSLYSLQTGAAYATMFCVQRGAGRPIEVLKTFQWNVRWRAHFGRNAAGNVQQLPPRKGDVTDMNVSMVFDGAPTDPRFRGSVDDVTLPICNPVVRAAFANPVRTESMVWTNYDVRH